MTPRRTTPHPATWALRHGIDPEAVAAALADEAGLTLQRPPRLAVPLVVVERADDTLTYTPPTRRRRWWETRP